MAHVDATLRPGAAQESGESEATRIGHAAPPDLVLQVQSWRDGPPPVPLHARLSAAGGALGRAPGNDLVLDDPARFISRRHATVRWHDGRYRLRDEGGNPSVVNDRPLGPGAEAALGDGDRIAIGDYVIVAALVPAAEVAAAPPEAVPAPAPASRIDAGPADALAAAGILRDAPAVPDADPLGLDLFARLGEPSYPAASAAHSDHVPPQLHAMALPVPAIPDGYDPLADALAAPVPPQLHVPAAPIPPAPVPPALIPEPADPPAAAPGDGAVLAALLDGLGLPGLHHGRPALPPEELAREVGRMLRAATAGTMDVLRARALTKRESHIDLTMIAPRANNPLKFFPDAESALTQMLGAQVPGYLPPLPALAGAFDDLKAHELAVIAGMRAALAAVVQRFDPARIEGRFEEPGRLDRLLPAHRKARLWDRLVAAYGELARDADEDLQRLFGEKFSVAYEEQVERLRGGRGGEPD